MTGKRECRCVRARHVHGTVRAYVTDACRCTPCRRAASAQQKRKRHILARTGRWSVDPLLPAVGIRRRLQALACIGWSCDDLSPMLGTKATNIRRWRAGAVEQILPSTYRKIVRVYDEVWDRPPPGRYALKVRRLAGRNGWVPPLGWDDETIDDAAAQPQHNVTGPLDPLPCGTPAAARRHYRRGEKPCDACSNAERRRNTERAA